MTGPDGSLRNVLLVSNRRLDENAGRAAKFATRATKLPDWGWELTVGYVDPSATGVPLGIARCLRLANDADVINSVSNPPQLQIVGGVVARLSGTPWIAEFRDPLVANPDVEPDSVAESIRRKLERYIVANADTVVWYDGIQIPDEYFEREYPDLDTATVRQLPPIGFDEDVFETVEPETFDAFTITYAGSFYDGWIEPYAFLQGLAAYVDGTGTESADLQAVFYGDWDDDYQRTVREKSLIDYVQTHDFVPHERIVGVMKGSDALLYVGGDDPRNSNNLPSKLYDYLGAGVPILAVVDPSFRVADLITKHGFGIVVEPGDWEGIRSAIARIRSGEFEYAPDPDVVAQFTRSHSLDAYVAALNSVTESG